VVHTLCNHDCLIVEKRKLVYLLISFSLSLFFSLHYDLQKEECFSTIRYIDVFFGHVLVELNMRLVVFKITAGEYKSDLSRPPIPESST
jgi:hypothetical protein